MMKHISFFTSTGTLILALVIGIAGLGLVIQPASAAVIDGVTCNQWYTVQRGDYLVAIARQFDTTWQELAQVNGLENPRLIYAGNRLCVDWVEIGTPTATPSPTGQIPNLNIIGVRPDQSVTVRGQNFPGDRYFNVLMRKASDPGFNRVYVDTIQIPKNGQFRATFLIPDTLEDSNRIVVRLDSPTSNYYSFNTFNNTRAFGGGGGGGVQPTAAPPIDVEGHRTRVKTWNLSQDEEVDAFVGNAGVYLPNSGYDAALRLARIDTSVTSPLQPIQFEQQLLEMRVFNSNGTEVDQKQGLTYLYFNLDQKTKSAWEQGDLNIYRYNSDSRMWEVCEYPIYFGSENEPYGRLACLAQNFGLFGLAIER